MDWNEGCPHRSCLQISMRTARVIIKGIKNGCPCIVGIQRHAGLCLGRRPWTSRGRVQGRSQCTTLSASGLHNARETILNPFYNLEYEIMKKITQNTTWIEVDILRINLTSFGTMHSPQPLSMSATTSQSNSTPWRHNSNTENVIASARERGRNRFELYGSALEHQG